MLLIKEVEVRLNPYNVEHYVNLGYDIPMRKASKWNKDKEYVYDFSKCITVNINDLQHGSKVVVDVLCDYCNEEILQMPYDRYNIATKTINKVSCEKCRSQKIKEVNIVKYGVDNPAKRADVQEKKSKTMLERYGVENPAQIDGFAESAHNTWIKKYGEDYRKMFTQKAINTFRERTGYEHMAKSPEIAEKKRKTCIERYGVAFPTQSPEVQEKIVNTMYKNSSQRTSIQQRYLCHLYNGLLNYPIKHYSADVYLPEDNIVIEYDGGGHKLSVDIGYKTEAEYLHHEIVRNNVIKNEGYRQMRIISSKDFLPPDDILLQMLEHTRQYFNDCPEHSWIEYNIDTSTVRNAEQMDGVFFDFGELRKIKKNDMPSAA